MTPALRRLAMRLRSYRERVGMTQEQLAKRAGISRVYLAMLETRRQDPRLSVLVKLARALKVKVGDLVD
jgi:transcriptional regulator with XRE-family HTH domain